MTIKQKSNNIKISRIVFAVIIYILVISISYLYPAKSYSAQIDETKGYSFSDKVVIAYYYIWFTKGWFEGKEGNAGGAFKDIHPDIGSYNSYDPHIIEEHIKMAKRAKIDAFAVSWWFDTSRNEMNDRLDLIFEKAKLHNFKVTIDLEAEPMTMREIYENLRYYLTNYRAHPAALKVEGKPAVLIWGSWKYSPAQWQKIFHRLEKEGLPAFYLVSGQTDPIYLGPFRCLEQYALVDNDDYELPAYYRNLRKKINEYNRNHPENPVQWHATIMPGFDERGIPGREEAGGAGWKERKNGDYYRMTFKAALASNPHWIHITSFNELAEHSHIEPTKEFGWTYIDMTAKFVEEFKK
jgi:hypothetical protein